MAKILLVDDQPHFMTPFSDRFEFHGHEVTVEMNPKRALNRVFNAKEPYDCIVTDYLMPEFRGHQLKEAILKINPNQLIFLWSSDPAACPDRTCLEKGSDACDKIVEALSRLNPQVVS